MSTEPKWRRFEKLVAQVQEKLAPNALVTHNDRIKGHQSGRLRQIDISVKGKVGQYEMLIVMDCKDYKVPVDVKDAESFIGLVNDVRAHKGVMVAANGFTETAKQLGEQAGLNLYRLIDTEAHDWQTYVSMPVVCDFRGIKSYQFILNTPLAHVISQKEPRGTEQINVYDVDYQRLGNVLELLKARWNSNKLPSEVGEHRNLLLTTKSAKILHENKYFDVTVTANIIVERKLFFGELPLVDVKGLRDEYTGRLLTPGFTTGWLNLSDVERNWRRLHSGDEIAITPFFTLEALDIYT